MNFQINITSIQNGFLVNYNRGESGYMTNSEKNSFYCKTIKEVILYIHHGVLPKLQTNKEGK